MPDPQAPADSPVPARNPFVSIPYAWRAAIVIYALVWKMMPAVISAIFYDRGQEYVLARLLLEVTTEALLVLPFFLRRIGGTRVGWLHPLVFCTLLTYGIAALQNTGAALYPVTVWFRPIEAPFYHRLLHGWLAIDVAEAHLKGDVLILISTMSVYVGFILFRSRVHRVIFGQPKQLSIRLFCVFVAIVLLGLFLIQSSGGVVAHITSFAQGRFRVLGGLGHITAIIGFAPALMAMWFVFDRSVVRRPWFVALIIVSLGIQFVTSGSRSATFLPAVLVAGAWIYHRRRLPAARLLPVALVALVGIGVLGEIRTSGWSRRSADFSALTNFDLTGSLETAEEELDFRSHNSAFLPTIAFVPDRVGLLWGRTYVGAVAFFIPRALWTSKPRGAGAHVAAMIFGGMSSADGYVGGGVPPGPVAEAYWNFHVPGVIVIFALFGAFQRWLAEVMRVYDGQPAAVAFYLVAIFYAPSPASDTAIALAQKVGALVFVYLLLGVLPFRRAWAGRYAGAPVRRASDAASPF